MQKNRTHISSCGQMRIIMTHMNSIFSHSSAQTHRQTHSPGLTESLPKCWTLMVPPPSEPDLNSPFWPTGLLTQRPHISLRHKGKDQNFILISLIISTQFPKKFVHERPNLFNLGVYIVEFDISNKNVPNSIFHSFHYEIGLLDWMTLLSLLVLYTMLYSV